MKISTHKLRASVAAAALILAMAGMGGKAQAQSINQGAANGAQVEALGNFASPSINGGGSFNSISNTGAGANNSVSIQSALGVVVPVPAGLTVTQSSVNNAGANVTVTGTFTNANINSPGNFNAIGNTAIGAGNGVTYSVK